MEEPRNLERLASVETEVKGIKDMLLRIDSKLDTWNQNYVPRQEINEMFRARDKDINDNRELFMLELNNIRTEKSSNKSLWASWASVIVAGAALLISLWPRK